MAQITKITVIKANKTSKAIKKRTEEAVDGLEKTPKIKAQIGIIDTLLGVTT